jgi:uncharacterized protein
MTQPTHIVDLGNLDLHSGEASSLSAEVTIAALTLGGQSYLPYPAPIATQLDVNRMTVGYALRLRYQVSLAGPCMRCLEGAEVSVTVDSREVDQPGSDDKMRSPYLTDSELDLGAWARDALALALPSQIFCSSDCLGLCSVCGKNLNWYPDHYHEPQRDPRFAALDALRGELD